MPINTFEFSLLQSDCGSALYIPRENGLTRVYVQLSDQIDSREDRQKVTLEVILEQASRNFQPFSFKAKEIIWWTNYVGKIRIINLLIQPFFRVTVKET